MLSKSLSDEITVNIKTFMRPQKFKKCLECVVNTGAQNIIVGHDGPDEMWNEHVEICNKASEINAGCSNGIEIKIDRYPFNSGLSKLRNEMCKKTTTKYLLQVDDDNYIPSNTLEIVHFLEKHDEIGGVCLGWIEEADGELRVQLDAKDIEFNKKFILLSLKGHKQWEYCNSLAFVYPFEFISNLALFRTELFDDVQWDEKFVIGNEHFDFYLTLKSKTDWKMAACPSIYAIHDRGGSDEFMGYRTGRTSKEILRSNDHFRKKWDIEGGVIRKAPFSLMYLNNLGHLEQMKKLENEARAECCDV